MTTADALVEDLKSPGKFDLRSALTKTSYPTDEVTIYLDGDATHERNLVLDMIEELQRKAEGLTAEKTGGITDDPEKETVDALIVNLEAREKELLAQVRASALKFTLRGVAPSQWRIVDKEARRKIKPLTKSEEDMLEASLERNEYVQVELLTKATVKITDANGNEDTSALKREDAQTLFDTLLESEWIKLKDAYENITFAHALFNNVVLQDADFLSKSSADPDKQDTSE